MLPAMLGGARRAETPNSGRTTALLPPGGRDPGRPPLTMPSQQADEVVAGQQTSWRRPYLNRRLVEQRLLN